MDFTSYHRNAQDIISIIHGFQNTISRTVQGLTNAQQDISVDVLTHAQLGNGSKTDDSSPLQILLFHIIK